MRVRFQTQNFTTLARCFNIVLPDALLQKHPHFTIFPSGLRHKAEKGKSDIVYTVQKYIVAQNSVADIKTCYRLDGPGFKLPDSYSVKT
jgi:hypothetical protein